MGKRKQLPDHSGGVPVHHGFFSDEQIEEIQGRYGFREDFPLGQHLEEQAENYLLLEDSLQKSPVSEQKELLREIAERTDSLLVPLKKIGLQEDVYLLKYLFSLSGKPLLKRHELIDEIRDWNRASKQALSELKKRTGKGGRPSDRGLRTLVRGLHEIYRDGTGREARITKYSDGRDRPYSGKFFNFVDSFLKDIGQEKQNTELGKAIEKSLKGIPKTPPKNS